MAIDCQNWSVDANCVRGEETKNTYKER